MTVARSIVNLTVHGIGPSLRTLDPGEDETWISVDQFEQVLDVTAGRGDVRISFDDSNSSDIEIALPRLLDRGMTADFFVLAGLLGEPGRLCVEDVHKLDGAGMRIGSHGWAHRDWRRIDARQAAQELLDARSLLGEVIGRTVSTVAVPFGSYDRHVLRRLRRVNVERVYTSDGGRARPGTWLQPRTSLRHDLSPDWIRRIVDEPPSMLQRARKLAARTVKRTRG